MGPNKGIFVLVAFMVLITLASAQSTTFCTSETNASTGQIMKFNLNNVAYDAVQNFITPSSAGITINGVSYTLYPDIAHTINQNTGAYVELTQINYIPQISSVNFILCSGQQGADTQYSFNLSANEYGDLYFTHFGTKLIITSNISISQAFTNFPTTVTMANVTDATPSPPSGYVKLTTLNISVVTTANAIINVTQSVPCYVSPSSVAVYKLVRGSWALITGYTLNSTSCAVTAVIPSDPIVGMFYSSQGSTSSASSTTSAISSTTSVASSTTSMPVTTQPTSSISAPTSSTASTSSISLHTTLSTTTASIAGTSVSSYPTTISISPQTSVPTTNAQAQSDLISYAILGAVALLVIYLIYLLIHK